MNLTELGALIDEVIVDAYGEDEQLLRILPGVRRRAPPACRWICNRRARVGDCLRLRRQQASRTDRAMPSGGWLRTRCLCRGSRVSCKHEFVSLFSRLPQVDGPRPLSGGSWRTHTAQAT